MFVKKEENFKLFLKQRAWQTWILPLMATLPANADVSS